MQISIANILSGDDLRRVHDVMGEAAFEDGRRTAGWAASGVKANEQARSAPRADALVAEITARIEADQVFQLAVRPKRLLGLRFARYRAGHGYGSHVDNALMEGARTDVSFTLFLSEPDSYAGGELVIESASGEEEVKLPAGHLFAYPSTTLHRVGEVTSGERLVLVGWVRSLVRDAARRELLFDLETARRAMFEREGKTREFDLISKATANLLRMWAED